MIRCYAETWLPRSVDEMRLRLRLPQICTIYPIDRKFEHWHWTDISKHFDLYSTRYRRGNQMIGHQGVNLNFRENSDIDLDEMFDRYPLDIHNEL